MGDALEAAAVKPYAANKSVIHVRDAAAVAGYLPPALRDSIPNLPGIGEGNAVAVVCSGSACQPPVSDPEKLTKLIQASIRLDPR